MVNLQQIGTASAVNGKRLLAVESPENANEADEINPISDRLSFDELCELAEECLEIDKEIKKKKEHKLKIWGEDGYLSKPLGTSTLERERLSTETLKSIDTLQSRKEYIEFIIYSNRDTILSNISSELLRKKIGKPDLSLPFSGHRQYKPLTSDQFNSHTQTGDVTPFPEFVTRKFQAAYRRVAGQISSILDSKEVLINEFKRLFLKGNTSTDSKVLIQILIEHKRNYPNITNSAA